MENVTRIGKSFFHIHPSTQRYLKLDDSHVIVDKQDYEMVLDYLLSDPQRFMDFIKNGRKIIDMDTDKFIEMQLKAYKKNLKRFLSAGEEL